MKILLYLILGTVYVLLYPIRIKKNKVTFVSLTTDKLEKDFELLANDLAQRQSLQLHYVLFKYDNSLVSKINYLFSCMKQVYHINTSELVILDYNNYVATHFKKKSVKVLQIWHASGAIKQFGNDIDREYKIKNYDYVLATSEVWKAPYGRAFGVTEEQVVVTGLPLNDYLHSANYLEAAKLEMYEKYPQLKNKKVVLYAPTFRGHNLTGPTYQPIDLDKISQALGEEYVVLYKLHPLLSRLDLPHRDCIIDVRHDNLLELFSITDYLITDYSAILFDFSILKRPIIAFVPDIETYKKEVGMYIDYEETIPAPICLTEQDVVKAILEENFDLNQIEQFNQTYFNYHDSNSTKRVGDFVEKIMK